MAEYQVLDGDCLDVLPTLDAGSVQTCITSPPYFGLRDYGTGIWEGGDPNCDHTQPTRHQAQGATSQRNGRANVEAQRNETFKLTCGRCGATRVDHQIGLEETPEQYVANLVAVFREVRRVLRDDGTLWLNLGDSYNAYNGNRGPATGLNAVADGQRNNYESGAGLTVPTMKPKDLVGIPWMAAFALRADGWYLRADIIWAKPNPMPESVTDRPTKAHEYLFLFTKSQRYHYDAAAIREEWADARQGRDGSRQTSERNRGGREDGFTKPNGIDPSANGGRNKRSVWTVASQPFPGAHFATFPPKLIEPCVLAGSSPQACAECGAPWQRITETTIDDSRPLARQNIHEPNVTRNGDGTNARGSSTWGHYLKTETKGWEPSCNHPDGSSRCLVLDPFGGAGTTGLVALRHDRDFLGIELNAEYAKMARDRIYDDGPLLNVEVA